MSSVMPTTKNELLRKNFGFRSKNVTNSSSSVVMVRKTEKRVFASGKKGEEPTFETITKETYETFLGNKCGKKVTSVEKRNNLIDEVSENLSFDSKSIQFNPKKTICKSGGSNLTKEGQSRLDASTFVQEFLKAHNHYRSLHNVPPLKLNRKISAISQKWADFLATRAAVTHSTNNKEFGENIFCYWTTDDSFVLTGNTPVDMWYKEMSDYDFNSEPKSLKCGHFTQIIWKETKELGVALTHDKKSHRFIVVANYFPAGNILGCFKENVPPLAENCTC